MAMSQVKSATEPLLEPTRAMLDERLNELNGRVKAVAALISRVKGEKALLERRIEQLEATLAAQAAQMKAVQAGRKKDQEQLLRLQEERDGVRLKVDRVLEEIARIEAFVERGP
jgi:chromosome segregation ATPase